MNEFELIRRYFAPLRRARARVTCRVGIGDDAALLRAALRSRAGGDDGYR